MAMLTLTEAFRPLTVGKDQLLTITHVDYDEKYMKAKVTFADADGCSATEYFTFKGKKKGEKNTVALAIFSNIAYCATHDFTVRDIDPTEIEGKKVIAEVYEQEYTTEQGETKKFIHLKGFKEAPTDDDADDTEDDSEEDVW